METNDTDIGGGEELSLDEAAKAYAATTTPEAVTDQADDEDEAQETTEDDAPDEGEDVEGDGEAEAEDQSDEAEEPETEQGRFVADNAKVKLPDGRTVTVAELKSGSLMHADYTRKTQEVAAERKAITDRVERATQQEQQLQQQFEYVSTLLQSFNPQPPDPSLMQTDPIGYMQAKDQFERMQGHLSYIADVQQRTAQERQAAMEGQRREHVQREWDALLGKAEDLRDRNKLEAFATDLKSHGATYGFTPQELANVALDHRQALVLRDAIAWRKLQSSKPKAAAKVEGRPPVQKGGKRLTPDAQRGRDVSSATQRLKQSGRLDDAVAAYLASQKG